MEQDRDVREAGVAGMGYRLAAPALRARQRQSGVQTALDFADPGWDDGPRAPDLGDLTHDRWQASEGPGFALRDLLAGFRQVDWHSAGTHARRVGVIGLMGAAGFAFVLYQARPAPPGRTHDAARAEAVTLAEAAPVQTAPDSAAPRQAAQDQAAQDQTAPDQTAPDQTAPDQTAPDRTAPDQTGQDQSPQGRTVADRNTPAEAAPAQPTAHAGVTQRTATDAATPSPAPGAAAAIVPPANARVVPPGLAETQDRAGTLGPESPPRWGAGPGAPPHKARPSLADAPSAALKPRFASLPPLPHAAARPAMHLAAQTRLNRPLWQPIQHAAPVVTARALPRHASPNRIAAAGLPRWLTESQPAKPATLVMSEPPHNLTLPPYLQHQAMAVAPARVPGIVLPALRSPDFSRAPPFPPYAPSRYSGVYYGGVVPPPVPGDPQG